MFDIVIPVHNAMQHVRACVNAVFRHASQPCHLYIVDDASDAYTRGELLTLLKDVPKDRYTLIRHEQNQGYLQSVNEAARLGGNPYVVLLNSDAMVVNDFMARLAAGFSGDASIGVITAVSNWANWTRICDQIPEGFNVHQLSDAVARLGKRKFPEVFNASGFFFAVRRELFEALDGFDEAYGEGYWEETDFCMRALKAGARVVVDDQLYVYHYGWGSFQEAGRNRQLDVNQERFMARWNRPYRSLEKRWQRRAPLAPMTKTLSAEGAWRKVMKPAPTKLSAKEAMQQLASLKTDLDAAPLYDVTPVKERKPRILYLLPGMALYGGIISVLQVVNQLILRGYDANIAVYGEVDASLYEHFPCYFRGYHFKDEAALMTGLPDCDLLVATRWDTAFVAVAMKAARPEMGLAYFVQDYEPDFYGSKQAELAEQAARSYRLIRHKIVKTHWLARKLAPYGGEIHRIPLGLNLDVCHDHGTMHPMQILALARPSSERRNFPMLRAVYLELYRRRPDLKLALYGDGYEHMPLPFPCHSYGKLSSLEAVAAALNESAVLLDVSTFQGFGRPGLEAMACGVAAVLTREGGITQYAKHGYNCLLINPHARDAIVEAVLRVIDDNALRQRLVGHGYTTAQAYSLEAEGERTATLFRAWGLEA